MWNQEYNLNVYILIGVKREKKNSSGMSITDFG